jgi:hypothetical protein
MEKRLIPALAVGAVGAVALAAPAAAPAWVGGQVKECTGRQHESGASAAGGGARAFVASVHCAG